MIIGVNPAGFDGVEPGPAPQIRISITMKDDLPRSDVARLNNDRFRWVEVFGRLKPDITMEKAQTGVLALAGGSATDRKRLSRNIWNAIKRTRSVFAGASEPELPDTRE